MSSGRKLTWLVTAVGLAAALWLLLVPRPAQGPGGLPKGGDFTLKSADGPVVLADLRGKVVLIYFGYLNCPDVCPTSVAAAAQALTALSPDEAARTRLLYISLDPERDDLDQLKAYAAYFHPGMIGATGNPAEIAVVARAYGVSYIRQPAGPEGVYAVDHSADTYVVGPDGRLAEIIPYGTLAPEVAATVRRHLP